MPEEIQQNDMSLLSEKGKRLMLSFLSPVKRHPICFLFIALLLAFPLLGELYGEVVQSDYKYLCRTVRSLLFCLTESYILTYIVYKKDKIWIKLLVYFIIIFIYAIHLFLKYNFGTSFTPQIMVLVAETTLDEASEFLQGFLLSKATIKAFAIVLAISAIGFFLEKFNLRFSFFLQKQSLDKWLFLFCGIPILIGGWWGFRSYIGIYTSKTIGELEALSLEELTTDNITQVVYSIVSPIKASKEQNKIFQITKEQSKLVSTCAEKDSLSLIVVIGESYIRSHSQLYGYSLETTPLMKAEQSKDLLYAFQDVITSYNTTSNSLKNVFSCNSISDNEKWFNFPLFPVIFKTAGYYVSFWDGQWNCGKSESVFDFSLNSIIHKPLIHDLCYDELNKTTPKYDADLIEDFISCHDLKYHELIIFHLMGQHYRARERYPHNAKFKYFDSTEAKPTNFKNWLTKDKQQEIAEYDNATRYNDYVLNKLFDYYRDKNTVIVYFSDHGEEIYDVRDFKGRDHSNSNKKNIVESQNAVPFVVWCSPKFKSTHSEVINKIKKSLDKPFMIDNVCQMLFYLGSIETNRYYPQRNPLSDNFMKGHRWVYDLYDYDSLQ